MLHLSLSSPMLHPMIYHRRPCLPAVYCNRAQPVAQVWQALSISKTGKSPRADNGTRAHHGHQSDKHERGCTLLAISDSLFRERLSTLKTFTSKMDVTKNKNTCILLQSVSHDLNTGWHYRCPPSHIFINYYIIAAINIHVPIYYYSVAAINIHIPI